MNDWKPAQYPSVSPYLVSKDAEGLIRFLTGIFDASVTRRIDRPDGSVIHAEVRIDDSIVMIGGSATDHVPTPAHIHVYVRDAAALYERALKKGARSVQAPARKHHGDDLRAGFADTDGNAWWVANQ
ncbi:Glyoxalase family protein [Candidatus Burkholderia humilis]|nr:Glyoxalase family protein [Candidatus Burkholderia humilis]